MSARARPTTAATPTAPPPLTAAAGTVFKRQFKVEVLYDDDKLIDGDVTLRIYEGATEVQKLIIGRDLLKARN